MMTEDLLRELAQIQQYASGLQGLMAQAQSAAPEQAEGTDASGAVRVVLGPDGLPESVRVEAGWQRRVEPAAFGNAVVEACQAAMGARMAAWTARLEDERWQSKVDQLQLGVDERPAEAGGEIPAVLRHPMEVQPRAIDEITEDLISAFDSVGQFTASPSSAVTSSNSSGNLVITLSKAGLVSCAAEPRWVSQQTATRLMNALSEALAAARVELAKASDAPKPTAALDRLFAEALAALNDPQRLTD